MFDPGFFDFQVRATSVEVVTIVIGIFAGGRQVPVSILWAGLRKETFWILLMTSVITSKSNCRG